MPDWEKLVRERMGSCGLPPSDREEVISELAAHLEETYGALRAQGLAEPEALNLAMQEVGNWNVLAENIRHSKEQPMNQRTRNFWLPALANFDVASLFLLVLTQISLQPKFLVRLNSSLGIFFYVGWLLAQVLFGAFGAFLSRRGGGTTSTRVIAGIFPAIVMFGIWALVIPVSAFAEHNQFVLQHPFYYALGIVPWVVLPGSALLLGSAPFLKESKRAAA
jgi:hypothetical protein